MKKVILTILIFIFSNILVYADNQCQISQISDFNNYSSIDSIEKIETGNDREIYIYKSVFGKQFVSDGSFVSEEFSDIDYKYFKDQNIFYLIGQKKYLGKSIIYKNKNIIEEFNYSAKIAFTKDGKIGYTGSKNSKNILFDGEKYISVDDSNYIYDIGFTESGVFYYIENINEKTKS